MQHVIGPCSCQGSSRKQQQQCNAMVGVSESVLLVPVLTSSPLHDDESLVLKPVSVVKFCKVLSGETISGMLDTEIFELVNVTVTLSPVNTSFCSAETYFLEGFILNIFCIVNFAQAIFFLHSK